MKSYVHSTIASTFAWAGNIYDLTILTYVYTFFAKTFGLNYFSFSILFALGLIARAIGGTFFGNLADKIGRKPVLVIGTAGYAIFQTALALSPNVLSLFVFRFLQGVFMGAEWTAGTVIAYENAPINLRGIVTGIVQAGYGIGYALTGISYILLYQEPMLFLLTGGIPLILLPYIQFFVKESKVENGFYLKPRVKDYIPVLLKATLGMSGMFVAYFSVFGNYETIAKQYLHMNPSTLGLIMFISNIGLAFSFILFGRLADIFDKRKLIYVGVSGLMTFLVFAIPTIFNSVIISEVGVIGYAFSTGFWPLMRFPDHVISNYFCTLLDPWSGLALGVVSLASTTPHGAQSSPTPWGSHLRLAVNPPLHALRIIKRRSSSSFCFIRYVFIKLEVFIFIAKMRTAFIAC